MTTLACCRASSRTMASPIPLLPPVTMATLPSNDIVDLLRFRPPRIRKPNRLRRPRRGRLRDRSGHRDARRFRSGRHQPGPAGLVTGADARPVEHPGQDVALPAFVDGSEDAAFGDAKLSWRRIDAAKTDRRLKPRRFAQRQGSAASSLLQGSQLEHIAMPRRVVDVEAILGEIAAGAVVDLGAD